MLAPTSSLLTVSPPDSNFTPRREFLRNNTRSPSSFALLALAGTGLVRLSSFPAHVVTALRRAFEQRSLLRAVREDSQLNLCEFTLETKPWATSKNIESEKLFVDILAVVFQHGYTFLSTIDYGREHDDRVSLAFSRPGLPHAISGMGTPEHSTLARSGVPFALSFPSATVLRVISPPLHSTPAILQGVRAAWPRGVASEKKVSDGCYEFKLKGYRWFQEDTFATDSLRHILSLLNTLDSHAFTLLTSLSINGGRSRVKDLWVFIGPNQEESPDSSFSNGSNIEIPRSMSPLGPGSPETLVSPSLHTASAEAVHTRFASAPSGPIPQHPLSQGHIRAHTEPNAPRPVSPSGLAQVHTVLRKKTPTKSPLPRHSEEEHIPSVPNSNSNLTASSVGSVDMTGVGTAAQQESIGSRSPGSGGIPTAAAIEAGLVDSDVPMSYKVRLRSPPSPHDAQLSHTPDIIYATPHPHERGQHGSSPEGIPLPTSPKTPPLLSAMPPSTLSEYSIAGSPDSPRKLADVPQSVYGQGQVGTEAEGDTGPQPTPPLLGPTVFRDSAFSSSTGQSYEIPIAWTGLPGATVGENGRGKQKESPLGTLPVESHTVPVDDYHAANLHPPQNIDMPSSRFDPRLSKDFELPGAWQPTPAEEKPVDEALSTGPASVVQPESNANSHSDAAQFPERKDVGARVASPALSDIHGSERKSEVAMLGIMSGRDVRGQQSTTEEHAKKISRHEARGASPTSPTSGSGWVLVNVEGTSPTSDVTGDKRVSAGSPPLAAQAASESVLSGAAAGTQDTMKAGRAADDKRTITPPPEQASSMHPIAKVIVAADAVAPSTPSTPSAIPGSPKPTSESSLKRFFSRSKTKKKRRKSTLTDGGVEKIRSVEVEEREEREDKIGLMQKWRKRSTVEASRAEKRVSID